MFHCVDHATGLEVVYDCRAYRHEMNFQFKICSEEHKKDETID